MLHELKSRDRRAVTELREYAAAMAHDFRAVALEVARDPAVMRAQMHRPSFLQFAYMGLDAAYNPYPLRPGMRQLHAITALERAVVYEACAYGDAGTVLALPGPTMSGTVVTLLGDAAQRERYFSALAARPTWTFFAMTEQAAGSDPERFMTSLAPAGDGVYRLAGEKMLIGCGAVADVGVVFARRSSGPLGIEAVLLDGAALARTKRELLPMSGARGAMLSHLRFDGVEVRAEDILGRHLPPSRRGLVGAIATFAAFRPCVAALALGTGRAALDEAERARKPVGGASRQLAELRAWHAQEYALMTRAAVAVDCDSTAGPLAGVAKARAAAFGEAATTWALRHLGPTAFTECPLVAKWYRDARAFEYMEGVTTIHKLNAFHAYLGGRLARS